MRYEIKFNIRRFDVPRVISWLIKHQGFHKSYPDRSVYSIYFDTIGLDCAYDNLCGISERKKYRLRWYGQKDSFYGARYELKIKKASLGTKQFLPSRLSSDSLRYIPYKHLVSRIKKDKIEKLWKIYPLLFPNLLVIYNREYFESFKGIRVTIDSNLRFFNVKEDDHLNKHTGRSYNGLIIEIKFEPQYRDIIAEMLRDFQYYPVRTSKYVLGLSYFQQVNYI
jgi:hypothetical protein